jgi:hypothetical protein
MHRTGQAQPRFAGRPQIGYFERVSATQLSPKYTAPLPLIADFSRNLVDGRLGAIPAPGV